MVRAPFVIASLAFGTLPGGSGTRPMFDSKNTIISNENTKYLGKNYYCIVIVVCELYKRGSVIIRLETPSSLMGKFSKSKNLAARHQSNNLAGY